jgi:hypothetical protein
LKATQNVRYCHIIGWTKEGGSARGSRLHNEEFLNSYTSSHVIRVIKSRRIRWVAHAAHMGEMRNVYKTII